MTEFALIHTSPFYELAALLTLAAVVGFVGLYLRQPMVVSFIAVGILAGPSALNIVQSKENVDLMAELGIAILLFLVGLKLDFKLVRALGAVSLATGLGQVAFTSITGFGIGILLGLDYITSIYVAVALTFSSTIIIVKLLSDKREVDSLHGRIAIGFLIIQDIVVILAMMVLSSFGIGDQNESAGGVQVIAKTLLNGALMLIFILLFIRFLSTRLVSQIAHSSELLITFVVAWAALLATVGHWLGFSKELGGLLAGISLASTPFREAIVARLAALRDFLLLFFFIALGTQLDLRLLGDQLGVAAVFSLFVLIGNPLIVMIIMGYMGYRKRTSFMAGLTVAQISEFSLIFIAMGQMLGHVNVQALGLVTLVGLVTIAISVYMITYSHVLYRWLEPMLGIFERKVAFREEAIHAPEHSSGAHDVLLFGIGRYGKALAHYLHAQGMRTLAVDFDPDQVKSWGDLGYDSIYGDVTDPEFIASLPLQNIRWVVCTLPQHEFGVTHQDARLNLIDALKQQGYTGRIAVTTHKVGEIEELRRRGADLVLCPFLDAAERAVARMNNQGAAGLGGDLPTELRGV